ncbi:MAG: ATP-binding cassette domain-containing protein [Dehalococcoidia bacterium]|nr:ATP-binding cassette domain-containing protein [Dehalococcoidia bacterium]
MDAVEVSHVSKVFRTQKAVDDVSFHVERGEIFGMVGPNGAGKTTVIRMLMDIIRPDSGQVLILGKPLNDDTKNRLGYLPEERGLYRRTTVMEALFYLSALKGVKRGKAAARAEELLDRVNMLEHKQKRIEELSRGMGQIIQFVSTILHEPDLIILDEPFSGLDPVNTELLKELILEYRQQGRSVILSTHIMNQVEELCDRFLMINKGKAVLYGSLLEIKSRYRSNSILLECDRIPEHLPGIAGRRDHGKYMELLMNEGTSSSQVLAALVRQNIDVRRFEVSSPSLHEIFLQVVREGR